MATIRVYDKPMCCNTGVCGPSVDPVLPQFAADLDWLQRQGHTVERFNLAQEPQRFLENAEVQGILGRDGVEVLPLIEINGRIAFQSCYPTRVMFEESVPATPAKVGLATAAASASSCGCGPAGCG